MTEESHQQHPCKYALPSFPLEALNHVPFFQLDQKSSLMDLEEIRMKLRDLRVLGEFKLKGFISPTEEKQAKAAIQTGHCVQLCFCCPEKIEVGIQELRNNRIRALALFSAPSSVADFTQIKDLAEEGLLEDPDILSSTLAQWAKTSSIELFLEWTLRLKNEMPAAWTVLKAHPEILQPTFNFFYQQPAPAFLQLIEFCKKEIPESMHLVQESGLLSESYLNEGDFLDLNLRLKVLELLEMDPGFFLKNLLIASGLSVRSLHRISPGLSERLYPILADLVKNYPFKNSEKTLGRFGEHHAEAIACEPNDDFLPQVECFIKNFERHPKVMEGFFKSLISRHWRAKEIFPRLEVISKGLNMDTSKNFLNNILCYELNQECLRLSRIRAYLHFLSLQNGFTQESISLLLEEGLVNAILHFAELGNFEEIARIKEEFVAGRFFSRMSKFKIHLTADTCQYGIRLQALISNLLLGGKEEEARKIFETLGKGIKGLEFPERPQLSVGSPYRR